MEETEARRRGSMDESQRREQAAMVALIRHRGVADERVLHAMETVPRHLSSPAARLRRLPRLRPAHRSRPDHLAALHRRPLMAEALELTPGGARAGDPARARATRRRCLRRWDGGLHGGRIAALCDSARGGWLAWATPSPRDWPTATRAGRDRALRGHHRDGGGAADPEPLLDQLDEDGRMVVPVGPQGRVRCSPRLSKKADAPAGSIWVRSPSSLVSTSLAA